MEINLNTISVFLERNRQTDGTTLVQFNGHEIGFKPTGSDSIGGFLGWRNEEQENINNRIRDQFLKFVLKQFGAKNASQLPESVKNAMELKDYCGFFGDARSLTENGGTSTGKPLSLRRIRTVVQAIKDCRPRAVSQIDQALTRLQTMLSSPSIIRNLELLSQLMVNDWTNRAITALNEVRAVIAKESSYEEIVAAIKQLHEATVDFGVVVNAQIKKTEENAAMAKEMAEKGLNNKQEEYLNIARKYKNRSKFANFTHNILKGQLKELAGLYNVRVGIEKPKPANVSEERTWRVRTGAYYTAVTTLNRFRYDDTLDRESAKVFEFGHTMRNRRIQGRMGLLLEGLKTVIEINGQVNAAQGKLVQENPGNQPIVLTEADFEEADVMPLRISDIQVSSLDYMLKPHGEEEDEDSKQPNDRTLTDDRMERQLERCLNEKVNQHLVKVGAMSEDELRQKLQKVQVPAEMAEAFSGLCEGEEMTVLERDLIADILQDYGIRFPEELEKTKVLDTFKSHCVAEELDPQLSLDGRSFIAKEVIHFHRRLKVVNLKENFTKPMLMDLFSKMSSRFAKMREDANKQGERSKHYKLLNKISYEQLDIPAFRFCMLTVPGFKEFAARHVDKINEISTEELGKLEAQFAEQLLVALKVDDVVNQCRLLPSESETEIIDTKIIDEMDADAFVKFCGVVNNFDTPELRAGKRMITDYVVRDLSVHLKNAKLADAVQFMKDKYPGNNSAGIPNAESVLNRIKEFIPKDDKEYRDRIRAIKTELETGDKPHVLPA